MNFLRPSLVLKSVAALALVSVAAPLILLLTINYDDTTTTLNP